MTISHSIQKNLTNLISISLAFVLSILFILIDINLDSWAEKQFTNEIKSQSYILKSLVSMNNDSLSAITNGDFLENENIKNIYYQIWLNNKIVLKSKNLNYSENLIKYDIPPNTTRVINVTLPDGDQGLATLSSFTLSSNDKSNYYITTYDSTKKLDHFLYILDTALIVSFFLTIFITRILARKIATYGLAPLFELNDEIKKTTDLPFRLITTKGRKCREVEPIYASINNYIIKNQELMKNEQRITSDIAHELRTPISEIMTLTEVYQRFPDDVRLSEHFTDDILRISYEMNNLINEFLSLQDDASIKNQKNEAIDIVKIIYSTKEKLSMNSAQVSIINSKKSSTIIHAKKFALSVILRNLLDNAIFYKSEGSIIEIIIKEYHKYNYIIVKNKTDNLIDNNSLNNLIKPLFKLDNSRKNNKHYGLGLTIVNKVCDSCNYRLFISQDQNRIFHAIIKIPML